MNASEKLLRIIDLQTQLGDLDNPVRAVDGVSFDIHRGETFVLVGESGCGKSMIAMSIMRLLPLSARIAAGDVVLQGESLPGLPEAQMRNIRGGRIGMIFQEPMTSLNPVLTVGEQVLEAVRLHDKLAPTAEKARVVELFEAVGIPDAPRRLNEYPHQLSGGLKQRVMIAMALAGRPDVLIADEPTTALDVTIQAQVLQLLKKLQSETGMAILLITHDLGVVAEMADTVGVMYAGQMVESAPVADFFKQPRHPYSQKLFRSLPSAGKRLFGLDVIPGIVPALNQVFDSCRFADRCEMAKEQCQREVPEWRGKPSHGYRCHFAEDQIVIASKAAVVADEDVEHARKLLDVQNLKVHFPIQKGVFRRTVGHVKAVDGLNLQIQRGRTLALVGESGCGKTTVGKAILQLIKPSDGSVDFSGTKLESLSAAKLREMRKDFQIIFQDPASSMNPRMLVEDIIAEGMQAQGIGASREARRALILDLLARVGLAESALDRYPHEFSGGQRQRIAIARALAVDPKLIVCDEPTSALDVSVQAQVLNLLKELQAELKLSYLFITHNISVVAYLAHEVAVMYLGRIVEKGPVDQVLNNPLHPYTQALLSAVPQPDPETGLEKIQLQGDMPSPSNPPRGCHFNPRCPKATEQCRDGYPSIKNIDHNHWVSCWLASN